MNDLSQIRHPADAGTRPELPALPGRWHLSGRILEAEPIRLIEIHSAVFVVGRKPGSTLCLPLTCISGNHAEFEQRDRRLFVRDLGSTNGTFINGNRLTTERELFDGDLIQFASVVFRVGRGDNLQEGNTVHESTADRALAMMQFDRLINDGNVFPFFQPVIQLHDRQPIGYEVLGRSRLFGLQQPNEMFHAASQLNLEAELSEAFRTRGIEVGRQLPDSMNLFLNTHPKELGHPRLYESLRLLRESEPDRTITLEIHEAAATDLDMMRCLSAVLRDLNILLAFDDFGVGRARLVELAEVRPDFLKFDMKLTKNIEDASSKHQQVVSLFARMVNDLGIQTLAEGVETESCHQVLVEMGFKLGQGFYYGRPKPISKLIGDPLNGPAGQEQVGEDTSDAPPDFGRNTPVI